MGHWGIRTEIPIWKDSAYQREGMGYITIEILLGLGV